MIIAEQSFAGPDHSRQNAICFVEHNTLDYLVRTIGLITFYYDIDTYVYCDDLLEAMFVFRDACNKITKMGLHKEG